MLQQLDEIWDPPAANVMKQIEAAAQSRDALLRQAALEALGRLRSSSDCYAKALGDPSKLVQRTAAWAMRQAGEPPDLGSPDDRTRWGATRVFAQHFASLAKNSGN